MTERTDNVYELDSYRGAERINGVKLHLGTMAVEELDTLIDHCRERMVNAQLDLCIVEDYRSLRFTPDDAA